MSLTDASFREFQNRLGRIRTIHASGRRFEAPGTLGAPLRAGRGRRRLALVVPLLMAAAALTGLKSVVHAHVGAAGYEARLAELRAGDGLARAGEVLMQPDPVTLALSAAVRGIAGSLAR